MTTKPKVRKAPAKPAARKNGGDEASAGIRDPVFAMIAEHKALVKEWHRINTKLDNARCDASETHGFRPWPRIAWRDYSMIGNYEIDKVRDKFSRAPGADHEQVEREYQDAKARLAAAERAGPEWDQRAGVAPLREQFERATWEEHRAATRLARTKPDTVAGAAALLVYLTRRERVYGGFEGWEFRALRTAAAALTRIGAEAA